MTDTVPSDPVPTDAVHFFSEFDALCKEVSGAQPATFLKHLTALAARWTRGEHAEIVLEDALQRRMVRGGDAAQRLQPDDAASNWIFGHGEPLVIPDLNRTDADLDVAFPDDGCKAYLGLPIVTDGVVRGVLSVRSATPRSYDRGEVEMVGALAALAALAVMQFEMGRRLDEHHRTMVRFALTDPLTNLASQQHFDHMLRREWRRAQAEVMPLSMLRLSIDAFEPHDGRIGPQRDREALVSVARVLDKAVYRPSDLVARLERGRFAILLPDTDHGGAGAIAQRLVGEVVALALPHPADAGRKLSLSIGVASHEPLDVRRFVQSPEDLVRTADRALEQAQTIGGNQVFSQ